MFDSYYVDYAVEKTRCLMETDSPTGYTDDCIAALKKELEELGYPVYVTNKGGLLADFGGEGDGICIMAHVDTIGAMVAEVKENGRLRLTNLGGLHAPGTEGECVRIHTRDGRVYEGTVQLPVPSVHVADDFDKAERSWKTLECVVDEDVSSRGGTEELGITTGDIVALESRFRVTESGYIKSRYLDDKLSVGIVLALAKYMRDRNLVPRRRLWCHFTTYEEVGHGASASLPEGVTEALSIDMGCVGPGLRGSEKKVSICVKDAAGPYSYSMVTDLVEAARREGAEYALDVFNHYGSDVETTLRSGYDIRHGLIGPGVAASHCYERSHVEGIGNTLLLLRGYLL